MSFILTTILPLIAPVFADGIRGIFAKFTGGAGGQPQNVNERIMLMNADTERVKALAAVDTPFGQPSQWIVDIRAIFRYAAITLIWLVTAITIFSPDVSESIKFMLLDVSGATMSFVIGERLYLNLKK